MATRLAELSVPGIIDNFHEGMSSYSPLWTNHCQVIPSTGSAETLAWMGSLPTPRLQADGRTIKEVRGFNFVVAGEEHECSLLINRNSLEDDQIGAIRQAIQDFGVAWQVYYDTLFTALLVNGGTATTTYDGLTFFADTRVIGTSANIDNKLDADVTTVAAPTAAEIQSVVIQAGKALMSVWQDDQGRVGVNAAAMRSLRLIAHPNHEYAIRTALNAGIIAQTTNVFMQAAEMDLNYHLTAANKMYLHATGLNRKGFIMLERVPLEILPLASAEQIAINKGLLILTHQRFKMTYGDPVRCLEITLV